MNILIELMPFLSGIVVGLAMTRKADRTARRTLWLSASLLFGLLVNQMSGEGLQWVLVDVALVAVSAGVVAWVSRRLLNY